MREARALSRVEGPPPAFLRTVGLGGPGAVGDPYQAPMGLRARSQTSAPCDGTPRSLCWQYRSAVSRNLRHYWTRPRFQHCDGTMPSVTALISQPSELPVRRPLRTERLVSEGPLAQFGRTKCATIVRRVETLARTYWVRGWRIVSPGAKWCMSGRLGSSRQDQATAQTGRTRRAAPCLRGPGSFWRASVRRCDCAPDHAAR
jgi:hypothetical protein